ncbi:MAG: PmoA family protein, partial [Chthoniobacteraceae bacterium]
HPMPNPARLLPALFLVAASSALAEVSVKQLDDRVRVELDGKLFTELRYTGTPHVCFYPIIGPSAAKMTRAYPMDEVPGEETDHIHHRSVWFAHGLVNGVDYWSEARTFGNKAPKIPVGQIVHEKVVKAEGGKKSGEVLSTMKWIAPDKSVPLTSTQRLVVFSTPDTERQFDFEVALTAGEKDVVFGETKEGTMAIRIAESMRVKRAKGHPAGSGQILSSEGLKNADAWGKPAKWVVMSGPIDGKPYSIAMFDHPKNASHPTRWHARDYGLFAANPFAGSTMDKALPAGTGNVTLKPGQTLTLKYRFLIQQAEPDVAKLAARFEAYAKDTH